jgi:hypothetical protein
MLFLQACKMGLEGIVSKRTRRAAAILAKLTDDQRRALRLLARRPDGCAQVVLQGYGLKLSGLTALPPTVSFGGRRRGWKPAIASLWARPPWRCPFLTNQLAPLLRGAF